MTRQLDKELEARFDRERTEVYRACSGGLADAVAEAGGLLQGLSAKLSGADCLLTVRAEFGPGRMVAFIGGEDLAACLRKAMREARSDSLRWKEDQYST